MRRRALAFLVLAACASREPPPAERASLGGDVARVGSTAIQAALVARVASARNVSARAALDMLIDDALAAEGARARRLDVTPSASWATTTTRARLVATRLRDDALAAGPPTDAEVEERTALHWLELDLPEQVRVVHAVVVRKTSMSPDETARARALAADILAAVADASSPEDFEAKASAVPHPGLEVVVQPLPPFVEDGRVAMRGAQPFFPKFAAGAFALPRPGATSGVVESEAGWHVIRLVERLPAKRLSLAERRALLTEEILAARAHEAREAILARLRQAHPITISPAAEATMASVSGS